MAEAMSSSEIEDVLSQVRRLVSDDQRSVPGRDGAARVGAARAVSDKLLLTPALRVVPQPDGSVARHGSAATVPDENPEILSLQSAFDAALRAEAARRAQHAPPPFGSVRPGPADQGARGRDAAPVMDGRPLVLGDPDQRGSSAKNSSAVSAFHNLPVGGRTIATDGANARPFPNVEPSTPTDGKRSLDDVPLPFAQVPVAPEAPEPSSFGGADVSSDVESLAASDDTDMARRSSPSEGSATDGLTGMATPGDDIVGSFASVRARHGTAWADRAAAEAAAQIAKGGSGAQVFDPDQEMSFDEEVLRDLVRDILREQLQGALGERITRNVRKLVRAELNRALVGRETD